ncbi:glutaredoxin 3 [Marinimicrobium alkaliphilum]|uniref:glutaredoxin 3 n=1 Tax=Marinimicrobium alkaliphilum TaxID=2202654 RepID=UPI000DBA22BB|nr:glutaredoxin 3 [Marinimicrobium alkaliphilum]
MAPVVIYTTATCPFCINAKQLLNTKGVAFDEIPVDGNTRLRQELAQKSGQRTVPQIWVGDTHVGGFSELWALDRSGKLASLLGT